MNRFSADLTVILLFAAIGVVSVGYWIGMGLAALMKMAGWW